MKPGLSLSIEEQAWAEGKQFVAGVDEVGRGCLAGPVVAAAVIFTPNHRVIKGVNDSKLLTASQRENLYISITQSAYSWAVTEVDTPYINAHGIVPATLLAMKQAVLQLGNVTMTLVDGTQAPPLPAPVTTMIKGDRVCYSIAAASIIAKVWRDRLMDHLSLRYPTYCWEMNKGYGTRSHRNAIVSVGITPYHRSLFVRRILGYA